MTTTDFLSQFREVDPRYTPTPAWWWSGEKLEIGRMRWQMEQMHAMGIRNIVIINLSPSGTLFGSDPDDPPFLSEDWWGIFEQVCEYAKTLGICLYFYDQIGFSGANFQAELVAQHPQFAAEKLQAVTAEGVGTLSVKCPAGATAIAAYVVKSSDPSQVQYLPANFSEVVYQAAEQSKLVLVCKVNQGFDFFSWDACQKLLDTVHRQFERRLPQYLGSTIIGSFQDELPELPTWGSTFGETFEAQHGYALEKVIHRLFEEGDIQSRITRVHYHAHRATLGEKALFKPFFEWHESHGLRCAFDQQSPAREARILGCVAKYADYTRTHQWYGLPGCDLHGNGKLHSSIAFLHDRKQVWLEGFHSTGWGGTIADTFDWLLPYLQAGSNLYNPHAIYYSTRKGWWEWAPPSTCWRQPYAMHYAPFAEMIARLQKLISQGVQQADVAVLFPTTSVQAAMGPQKHFAAADATDQMLHNVIGSMRWHQVMTGALDKLKIEYHLVDGPAILASAVEKGALVQRGVRLRALILPQTTMLADETLDRLIAFAKSGGLVVAVGSDTLETLSGKRIAINEIPGAQFVSTADELPSVLGDFKRTISAPVPTLYRKIDDVHLLFVPASEGMATVVKWDNWFAPQEHTTIVPSRYAKAMEIALPERVKTVHRFDPLTGESRAVECSGGKLALDFEGAPFVMLAWDDLQDVDLSKAELQEIAVKLGLEWECEYLPTLPREHADIYDSARPWQRLPHTVEMKWVRGDLQSEMTKGLPADAESVHATFGVRAWKKSQDPADEPLVYSPEFGIHQDKLHQLTLGPKGHVPEEFINLGKQSAGEKTVVTTGVVCDTNREAVLVIGANALKAATVNGTCHQQEQPAYVSSFPVRLNAGVNEISLEFTAERDGTIRAFWCFADPDKAHLMQRPERVVHTQKAIAGSSVSYVGEFELKEASTGGVLKLSVAALARVYVDEQLLGLQGGCDPYRPNMRGQTVALPALNAGRHTVRIELLESTGAAAVVVDGICNTASGEKIVIHSGANWKFYRDQNSPANVQVWTRQENDGAAWLLHRRPHPLPRATWLDAKSDVVLDLPLAPPVSEPVPQWFEWIIPPGARTMHLPLLDVDEAKLWIDGEEHAAVTNTIEVATKPMPARRAVLFARSRQLQGGVFASAITYDFGTGLMTNGDWSIRGLRSYSGAIRMRQTFAAKKLADKKQFIDFGHVRGTMEAKLNGVHLDVRFMSPYRFDVSELLRDGENVLELIVTNTLGNFLSTWSPSRGWSPDQIVCGIDLPTT